MGKGDSQLARRSFLSRLSAGATAFGAAFGADAHVRAQSAAASIGTWSPARHIDDDWLDQTAAKHRFFFDTTNAVAFAEAMLFANNFYTANRSGYGLADGDLAVVICARHQSTVFAYDDVIWAKYGAPLGERAGFVDPKTKAAPTLNVYRAADYGDALMNRGVTLDSLLKRGLRLAVCQMATRAYSGMIASKTGGNVDDVYKELAEHLVPNARLVPAGIVAVNRAQERGYSFVYAG